MTRTEYTLKLEANFKNATEHYWRLQNGLKGLNLSKYDIEPPVKPKKFMPEPKSISDTKGQVSR